MGYIRPSDAALGYSSALRLRAGYIADRKQTQPYSIPFWPILAHFGPFWPILAHERPYQPRKGHLTANPLSKNSASA
jgi:hypothetical protein